MDEGESLDTSLLKAIMDNVPGEAVQDLISKGANPNAVHKVCKRFTYLY